MGNRHPFVRKKADWQVIGQGCRPKLSPPWPPRDEEDQAGLAGSELHHDSGPPDPASVKARGPSGTRTDPPRGIAFSGLSAARQQPFRAGLDLGYPPTPESPEVVNRLFHKLV